MEHDPGERYWMGDDDFFDGLGDDSDDSDDDNGDDDDDPDEEEDLQAEDDDDDFPNATDADFEDDDGSWSTDDYRQSAENLFGDHEFFGETMADQRASEALRELVGCRIESNRENLTS